MVFAKRLRDGVRLGTITCSIRIWLRPRVTVGVRYRMDEGEIEVDSIEQIGFPDITPQLAVASGFLGVLDLLKVGILGAGLLIPERQRKNFGDFIFDTHPGSIVRIRRGLRLPDLDVAVQL